MLVLTRKPGEQIRIGNVLLTVLPPKNGRVRLGFDAPPEVEIMRTEIEKRLDKPQDKAAE